MAVAVRGGRGGVVCLVRPVVPFVFDRRSTKIRDRVGDFLVDGRNPVLRRTYPDVTFLAAIAPATAAATATPPAAVVAGLIGPGAAGDFQVLLIADIGVRITAGGPFRRNGLAFRSRHMRRRLVVREMRLGQCGFAFLAGSHI
jgi:hypothetical protein